MHTFILDKYNHQPLLKQFLGNTLTGIGWVFWIYLWLPLLAAIAILLGVHPKQQAASAPSESILALVATLVNHASVIVIMIGAFFAWSVLQWTSKHFRYNALNKQQRPSKQTLSHPAVDKLHYQCAQSMRVNHDANGLINRVEIISR
jgi:poly-beta-1,6-N-acetyl-D-glucosamine biosynthesis protein PgaD